MKKQLPVLIFAFFLYFNVSIMTVDAAEVIINPDQEKLVISKSFETIYNQEPGQLLKSEDIAVMNRSEEKSFRVSLSLEEDKFLKRYLSGMLILEYDNKSHSYLLTELEKGVLVDLLPNEKMIVCPLFELAGEPMKNDTQDQSAKLEYKLTIEEYSPNKYGNTSKVDNIGNNYKSLPNTGERNNGFFVAGTFLLSLICLASINKKKTSKNKCV